MLPGMESNNRLSWKGPSEVIYPNSLAMSRGIYNEIRLLRVLSSLTLSVSMDVAPITPLDNLCQSLTTLIVKYIFLIGLPEDNTAVRKQ